MFALANFQVFGAEFDADWVDDDASFFAGFDVSGMNRMKRHGVTPTAICGNDFGKSDFALRNETCESSSHVEGAVHLFLADRIDFFDQVKQRLLAR